MPGALKKAVTVGYQKLALTHHPDKGGDPETFRYIRMAYDTLHIDKTRQKYDREGKSAFSAGFCNAPETSRDSFTTGAPPETSSGSCTVTPPDVNTSFSISSSR